MEIDDLPDELYIPILCRNPLNFKLINQRSYKLYKKYYYKIWGDHIALYKNIRYLSLSTIFNHYILKAVLLSEYCTKEFIQTELPYTDKEGSYHGCGRSILHLACEYNYQSTKLILNSKFCDYNFCSRVIYPNSDKNIYNYINAFHIAIIHDPMSLKCLLNSRFCDLKLLKRYRTLDQDKYSLIYLAAKFNLISFEYLLESPYRDELISLPVILNKEHYTLRSKLSESALEILDN